ncbi:MAG TPA: DUF86 domain-containing protein [Candidatus Limnocylindrales bacterium]|nr:DUF86 domain-containing protein [Candidatus Limnocylindrales bacterium]
MSKDDRYYLRHMLDYSRKLGALAQRYPRAQYDSDEPLQAACRYWLQVIGEAARGLSPAFEEAHPDIPWRAMIGMRNRIVHDYLGIDDETVWKTVSERIPELTAALEALLPDWESPDAP